MSGSVPSSGAAALSGPAQATGSTAPSGPAAAHGKRPAGEAGAGSGPAACLRRALASLRGLSVGDALGSQFFVPVNLSLLDRGEVPGGPWQWTDDTQMACSVLAVLAGHRRIDQEALAASFARHHDAYRGYGPAVNRLLRQVREGGDWRTLAGGLFDGQGSWGNGAAMRIAPLGAWYAYDAEQATH